MARKIFISYRRGDDAGHAGRMFDQLIRTFEPQQVFMDVEGSIRPGEDFVEIIKEQITSTGVLLVIIGSRWSALLGDRANGSDDYVVLEIKAAIERDARLIPVLVGGTAMPTTNLLPKEIRRLVSCQAKALRSESFSADCQGPNYDAREIHYTQTT